MTIYLTIITTALVVTQIIRVLQNAQQLKKWDAVEARNAYVLRVYRKIEMWLDARGGHMTICKRCHGKGYTVAERDGQEGEIRCENCGGMGYTEGDDETD